MEQFRFHVLGCRGTRSVHGPQFVEFGGGTSCYLLRRGDYALILDCGTGLHDAKPLLQGCRQIDIALTHLHYDHILGLLNWGVFPKAASLRLFTPADGGERQAALERFFQAPFWPVEPQRWDCCCVEWDRALPLPQGISLRFAHANHPNDGAVLRVDTDEGSMALICDWEHLGAPLAPEMTQGCSFLLYDGMFTAQEYPRRTGWGHSTWNEAVKLARERQIPRLMITHHLPDRTDPELRQLEAAAREVFPEIRFARAGDTYNMLGEVIGNGI